MRSSRVTVNGSCTAFASRTWSRPTPSRCCVCTISRATLTSKLLTPRNRRSLQMAAGSPISWNRHHRRGSAPDRLATVRVPGRRPLRPRFPRSESRPYDQPPHRAAGSCVNSPAARRRHGKMCRVPNFHRPQAICCSAVVPPGAGVAPLGRMPGRVLAAPAHRRLSRTPIRMRRAVSTRCCTRSPAAAVSFWAVSVTPHSIAAARCWPTPWMPPSVTATVCS